MCNAAEHRSVDALIDCGPHKAGQLEVKVVQGEKGGSMSALVISETLLCTCKVSTVKGWSTWRCQSMMMTTLLVSTVFWWVCW